MTTGIYAMVNKINEKMYIGMSVNMEDRIKTHLVRSFAEGKEYDKPLYRAIRKYGIESFKGIILEICEKEKMVEKEISYIKEYSKTHTLYNLTEGGEGVLNNHGDNHPNRKLSSVDVVEIRRRYDNREQKNKVHKDYAHLIGPSGFRKIWQGTTWTEISMEVYTEENKKFQASNSGSVGSENHKAKLTESDVLDIRTRKLNLENQREIYKDYKDKLTFGSFRNVYYGYSWRHVQPVSTIPFVGE